MQDVNSPTLSKKNKKKIKKEEGNIAFLWDWIHLVRSSQILYSHCRGNHLNC